MSASSRQVSVLGAGIVGVACALELQREGHEVTLIDRLAPGEACSAGNAGVLAASACVPLATPGLAWKLPRMLLDPLGPLAVRPRYVPRMLPWLWRFARAARPRRVAESAKALDALVSGCVEGHRSLTEGTPAAPLVRSSPLIYVYPGERSLAGDAESWALKHRHGVVTRRLGCRELHDTEPALAERFTRGVLVEDGGYVSDPAHFVRILAEHLAADGATLVRREVRDVEVTADGGARIHTGEGVLAAASLVVAAGAWSARLAHRLGWRVPLESERGYHVTIHEPGIDVAHPVSSGEAKVFATPMAEGLRIAGTSEFAGLDAAPDWRRARVLLAQAQRLFPRVRTTSYSEWSGQRPTLPDSLPVIARCPGGERVYFAFGHQHIGLTAAPATARLVADLVAGRRPNLDPAPFRVDRF